MYEVIYSDGCAGLRKFKRYSNALTFAYKLIRENRKLKSVEIFDANTQNFHSSTDFVALMKYWGDGSSYWDNMALLNPKITFKRL